MKILKLFYLLSLIFVSSSFTHNKKWYKAQKATTTCSIICSFKPVISNISAGGFSNSIDDDNVLNISTSSGYVSVIDHNENDYVQVTVSILGTHPAGTVKVIRENILMFAQAVAANTNFATTQNFDNVLCTESFDVRWE